MKNVKNMLCCILMTLFLTGCKDVQIFEEQIDPNAQIELTDTELSNDTYYVKNGTKFISVYKPKGNASSKVSNIDKSRVFYAVDSIGDENLIPSHYKGEVVAYASETTGLQSVTLERFKDLGYSIGLYGGQYQNDGYYHIELGEELNVKDSTMLQAMESTPSTYIRVKSINGVTITEDMIDKNSGVFIGLEKGKTYKIAFFSGTYYYEAEVVADTHFLQSYELYAYGTEQLTDTMNGYMSFETPEDLKSGYYNIDGSGLFKYYNFIKGENKEVEIDMNENYYASEDEMIMACSAEYSFTIKEKTSTIQVNIQESEEYSSKDITAFVYSPNKTKYDMEYDKEAKAMSATIADAMPGKWKIHVLPREIVIDDIDVQTLETLSEPTLVEHTIELTEEQLNIAICFDYGGEGVVNGTVIAPNGETYIMEETDVIKEENGIDYTKVMYSIEYAEPGVYFVRAYHQPSETTIGEPYIEEEGGNENDVIIIAE